MKKIQKFLTLLCFVTTISSCGLLAPIDPEQPGPGDPEQPQEHTHLYTVQEITNEYECFKCCVCGQIDESTKKEHNFSSPVITKEATIEEPGTKEMTCTQCGHKISYSYTVTEQELMNKEAVKIKTEIDLLKDTDFSEAKSIKARYDLLNVEAKALVTNIGKLTAIIDSEAQYLENQKATALKAKIDALEVGDLEKANEYILEYEGLNDIAKALVTNIERAREIASDTTILNVIGLIQEIGNVVDSATEIRAAKEAYDALNEKQKNNVSNKEILTAAYDLLTKYEALDLTDVVTQQKAVLYAGLAYYYQQTQIQYDQYTSRRNMCCYPEDANAYNWTNLDCSSFCNSTYNYIFGNKTKGNANLITCNYSSAVSTSSVDTYAKNYFENASYKDIIWYANETSSSPYYLKTADQTDEKAAEIRAMMQPGDCYTYRHSGAGHIMLYIGTLEDGEDYFLHSTGSAGASTSDANSKGPYGRTTEDQTAHEKTYGSVCLDKAEIVFEKEHATESTGGTSNRYIFNSANDSWSIIRPLTRMKAKKYTLNSNGVARLLYPGISAEKSVSVGNYHSVKKNTEITYTIKVDNVNKMVDGIKSHNVLTEKYELPYTYIEEQIPANATFVSASDGGRLDTTGETPKIVWQLGNIESGKSKSVTYTLKATGETNTEIADYKTYVNGLRLNMINTAVRSDIDTSAVVNKMKAKVGNETSNFIQDIVNAYNEAYGVDLRTSKIIAASNTENPELENSTVIDKMFTSAYALESTSPQFSSIVPATMYGGTKVRSKLASDDEEANNNLRNIFPQFLEPGDIICGEFNGKYETYFYASTNTIYGVGDDGKIKLTSSTTSAVTQFVHTIPYYWAYVILRPSMSSVFN